MTPILVLATWGISGLFFVFQALSGGLGHYDSGSYLMLSQFVLNSGGAGFALGQDLRTMGYPALLAFAQLLLGTFAVSPTFTVFLLHTTIWTLVVLYSRRAMTLIYPKFATLVALILAANVFVAPYLSVSLTDGVYISLSILIFFWMWAQFAPSKTPEAAPQLRDIFLQPWFGIFLFSLALVIRPASVWLIVPTIIGFVSSLRMVSNVGRGIVASAAATAPIFWQSWLNYRSFGSFTPFPVSDLGGSQLLWGIENVKYATWLGGGSPANYYPSTQIIGVQDASGLGWYFNNPISAIQLLFFKFVGAFDFDYLTPYPSSAFDLSWLASSLAFLAVILALFVIFSHLVAPSVSPELGPRWLPLIFFLSWASVTMLSALELRFSLPILTTFLVWSLWSPRAFFSLGRFGRYTTVITGTSIFATMWVASLFIRTLQVSGA